MNDNRIQLGIRKLQSFVADLKSFVLALPHIFRRRRRDLAPRATLGYSEIHNDNFSRFLKQSAAVGVALLVVTSFAPSTLLEVGVSADSYETDSDYFPEDTLTEDDLLPETEDGFYSKTNPQLEETNYLGINDEAVYTVQKGDTLSLIAQKHGVNIQTVMWRNKLDGGSYLSIGQSLVIPSVDGVMHTVKASNETLNKIAKTYEADLEKIKTHNKLESDTIYKGQQIFIPGGKIKEVPKPVVAVREGARTNTRVNAPAPASSGAKAKDGRTMIFPTNGQVTRGFISGHYGVDIGNKSMPAVEAALAGTILKVKGGCPGRAEAVMLGCNGGYGNHVIIDHGDGLKTLYGHMGNLYVTEGQAVEQGSPVGQMYNSGRVYGPTGIHLHFEVIDNGVKRNPSLYY